MGPQGSGHPDQRRDGVEDGIRLNITKQQVQDLPPADIDHPDG